MNSIARAFVTAPIDDEPVTEDDGQAIRSSEGWFEKNGGKGIPMEEVLSQFGLSMKDFPLDKHGA